MAYFEDLSAYSYSDFDIIEMGWGWLQFRPGYDRINVGWLDASHAFEKGPTPNWFANALLDISMAPRVNTMRGFHQCPFARNVQRVRCSQWTIRAAPSCWDTLSSGCLPGRTRCSPRPRSSGITSPPIPTGLRPSSSKPVEQYKPGWTSESGPWIPHDAQRITFD